MSARTREFPTVRTAQIRAAYPDFRGARVRVPAHTGAVLQRTTDAACGGQNETRLSMTRKPMRRTQLVLALVIAPALSALVGHPSGSTRPPGMARSRCSFRTGPLNRSSSGKAPSAAPDHALLSAADVERSLPVPARSLSMQESATCRTVVRAVAA